MTAFYRLKGVIGPFYKEEGNAVREAKRIARQVKKPVLIEVDYDDGQGWQALRIEGREFATEPGQA